MRALGLLELGAAAGTVAWLRPAQWLSAGLLWSFAAWIALELRGGRSGAPCPCFGGAGVIAPRAVWRTLALALLATGVALSPPPRLSAATWLAVAVGAFACACAMLAWLAFTLAREVALLRARTPPRGALEIPEEGPPLGAASPLIKRFSVTADELAVAVFVSPGCRACQALEPAIAHLAAHPGAQLLVLDEQRDALAWRTAAVPGSPYAVALNADGVVLAKGTFNTAEQLESVPATAQRRQAHEVMRA